MEEWSLLDIELEGVHNGLHDGEEGSFGLTIEQTGGFGDFPLEVDDFLDGGDVGAAVLGGECADFSPAPGFGGLQRYDLHAPSSRISARLRSICLLVVIDSRVEKFFRRNSSPTIFNSRQHRLSGRVLPPILRSLQI